MGFLSDWTRKCGAWITRRRRFERVFAERMRALAERAAPTAIPATNPVEKRRA